MNKEVHRDIFLPRVEFKPFEYQEVEKFKEAIQHSFWLVSEWNFTSDIHDFKVRLKEQDQAILKKALLAISQIEVAVKKFWAKLGDRFPKAEFDQVGVTFGESECRHSDAYSHLLQVLGFNDEFKLLLQNPVIQGRVEYLTKYLKNAFSSTDKNYTFTLTLFSLFIENVSLFSQFLVIKSFNKYLNILKDIENVIQATMKEECIHALFGMYIINIIKEEHPDWFNDEFYEKLTEACQKAYVAEANIIDWIFETGELEFLPKDVVKEFIKDRINESIVEIGGAKVFDVDKDKLSSINWFNEEIYAETNIDFFYKKGVAYSKKTRPIKAEDLF